MASRDLLLKPLLLLISLGMSLFGVEMFLRSLDSVDVGTTSQYRLPHRVFGWALEPGASYINEMPERAVRVDYNSDGWRDIEHGGDRGDEGIFRIAVLGDSFMEAYSVPLEESFHRQLKRIRKPPKSSTSASVGTGRFRKLSFSKR